MYVFFCLNLCVKLSSPRPYLLGPTLSLSPNPHPAPTSYLHLQPLISSFPIVSGHVWYFQVVSFGNNWERSHFFSFIREMKNDISCFHYLCMNVTSLSSSAEAVHAHFSLSKLTTTEFKFKSNQAYSYNSTY